ncbi:MAG: hypothetical protein K2P87_09535 [Lachnospiraceae bacterium]|nr:hypothetical protein [Lachnospiraceae bacterium]
MYEEDILDEGKSARIQDDTDRCIVQALTDGLSDITVSRELFERTLSAAKKQKDIKREKNRIRRVWGTLLTAAAAVLVVVIGFGVVRSGEKKEWGSEDGMLSGSAQNSVDHAQQSVDKIVGGSGRPSGVDLDHDGSDGNVAGESQNESIDSVADCWGDDGGYIVEGAGQISVEEWIYGELIAEFDADGGGELPPPQEEADADTGETAGQTRSISWTRGEKELSCVVYAGDHRIVATLREGESLRRLELRDWTYADQLWELARE